MGFPAYDRVLAEVGHKRFSEIQQALVMLLPCPSCSATVCAPCVTVDGKNPGSPTPSHIARIRMAGVLRHMWIRMASEELSRIDKSECECLEKLGVGI